MLNLFLALLSSTAIAVLMRIGSRKEEDRLGMLFVNYVVCVILSALYCASAGRLLPVSSDIGTTLSLGGISGVLYLAAFLLMQWNTVNNGIVLSQVFMKLGVLVPTLLSVLVFHEELTVFRLGGIVLAICAILIMNLQRRNGSSRHAFMLPVLLLVSGLTDSMAKVYEQFGSPALENQYLLFTFTVAGILCLVYMRIKQQRISRMSVLYGAAIGIPNFLASKFLLRALSTVPAIIVYPIVSVGVILLVALCGVLIFREKFSRRQFIGMGLILCALVLLNL